MSTIDPGATPRNPRPSARRVVALVAAAVVLVGAAVGIYWAGRQAAPITIPTASASAPAGPVSSATVSPFPTEPSTAVSAQSSATAVRAIPVYYLADVAGGPRLYREFHAVALINGSPALTAVTEMLRGAPVDPDYSSLWPKGLSVRSLTVVGDLATVDVTGFVAVGASFEAASVQQLVYTVTAADPTVQRVRLLVNGGLPPSGHIVWSDPVSRANALDTQANVWILSPDQGATVASPVTVSVLGTGWEGNVPLRVYQGQTLVASTHVTTMMGGFAQAQTSITLSPGTYEVRAYNDNGRDDSLQLWDTKTFTVR